MIRTFLSMVVLNAVLGSAMAAGLPSNTRHVVVSGAGSVTAIPDIAIVELETMAFESTSLAAKENVDARINRFLDALTTLGIDQKDINASTIVSEPEYDYPDRGPAELVGFRATRTVTVTLRDITNLNELIDVSLKAGVDEVSDIDLGSSRQDALLEEARNYAISDSKLKAEQIAKQYDSCLGKIYSVDAQNQSYGSGVIEFTASRINPRDIRPGKYLAPQIKIKQEVTAIFYLTDCPP